jgi:carbamoyl-phosphate synthase large subunit
MAVKFLLLSAGSKFRLLYNFIFELSQLNIDFQIHVLDKNPNNGFDDKRVFFHLTDVEHWNSTASLHSVIAQVNADIILPTRNAELSLLSKITEDFKDLREKTVISRNDIIVNCTDKYALANSGQFDKQFVVETFDTFGAITGDTTVIKERFGAGSKGLVICPTAEVDSSVIAKFENPIFQNWVGGREFSADLYFTKSSSLHALSLRFRDKIIDGEATQATFFSNKKIVELITELVQTSSFRGPINIQGFIKESNDFSIFDINPRIGGSFFMSRFNGFELSRWLIQEYFESVTPTKFSCVNFSKVVVRNETGYDVK